MARPKGIPHTKEWKEKMSALQKGRKKLIDIRKKFILENPKKAHEGCVKGGKNAGGFKGTHSEETKKLISINRKGKNVGVMNHKYILDRTMLIKSEKKHFDGRYRGWAKAVKDRDNWVCRIADVNCNGRMEAHHILRWSEFPELRYEVNNGITLCASHHPRKRKDEERLAPAFRELVNSVN